MFAEDYASKAVSLCTTVDSKYIVSVHKSSLETAVITTTVKRTQRDSNELGKSNYPRQVFCLLACAV
jgi:hypothetical protein